MDQPDAAELARVAGIWAEVRTRALAAFKIGACEYRHVALNQRGSIIAYGRGTGKRQAVEVSTIVFRLEYQEPPYMGACATYRITKDGNVVEAGTYPPA